MTKKPIVHQDSNNRFLSFLRPTKQEASITLSKKECKLKYKHVKQIGRWAEAQFEAN